MLIICEGCKSRIKAPDKAAGKRVKCPKCATMIQVPALETPAESGSAAPQETGVSSTPMPPPIEPAPDETPASESGTEVTADGPKSSSGVKPPPLKSTSKRASASDDGDEDDEDEDGRPPKKKRRRDSDEDEDDDDLDVRKKRGRGKSQSASGLALTSMILGIAGVVTGLSGCAGCCCGGPQTIALICGIIAVICGHMAKSPGDDAFAKTGLICGYIAIGLSLLGVVMVVLSVFFNIGIAGINAGMNRPPQRFR